MHFSNSINYLTQFFIRHQLWNSKKKSPKKNPTTEERRGERKLTHGNGTLARRIQNVDEHDQGAGSVQIIEKDTPVNVQQRPLMVCCLFFVLFYCVTNVFFFFLQILFRENRKNKKKHHHKNWWMICFKRQRRLLVFIGCPWHRKK